jgi:hypothetical protein
MSRITSDREGSQGMRKSIAVGIAAMAVAVALAGCSAPKTESAPARPTVLGATSKGIEQPVATTATADDPAAVEHVPASSGLLVRFAEGATKIVQAKAIDIARGAAAGKGSSDVSAVHVTMSADISRPSDSQLSPNASSAWMVTFHRVQLSDGQTGNSTVLVNADTGDVIRTINYVPSAN